MDFTTVTARVHPLVAWAQAMGSDATDVRDAAHESFHAMQFGCKRWDRATIDKAAFAPRNRLFLVSSELGARAAERLVCEELGLGYEPLVWARTCLAEQAGLGLYHAFPPTPQELVAVCETYMERDWVQKIALTILMHAAAKERTPAETSSP